MNITKEVINDLLPLYLSEECSDDTKKLIHEYLGSNPEFAEQIKKISQNPLTAKIPHQLNKEDEMKTLTRTKRLIKQRTWLMAFAIMCSLAPFSFSYIDGHFSWLYSKSLDTALVYIILAVVFWIGYFMTKNKLRGI